MARIPKTDFPKEKPLLGREWIFSPLAEDWILSPPLSQEDEIEAVKWEKWLRGRRWYTSNRVPGLLQRRLEFEYPGEDPNRQVLPEKPTKALATAKRRQRRARKRLLLADRCETFMRSRGLMVLDAMAYRLERVKTAARLIELGAESEIRQLASRNASKGGREDVVPTKAQKTIELLMEEIKKMRWKPSGRHGEQKELVRTLAAEFEKQDLTLVVNYDRVRSALKKLHLKK